MHKHTKVETMKSQHNIVGNLSVVKHQQEIIMSRQRSVDRTAMQALIVTLFVHQPFCEVLTLQYTRQSAVSVSC